jgi:hypothetical protein
MFLRYQQRLTAGEATACGLVLEERHAHLHRLYECGQGAKRSSANCACLDVPLGQCLSWNGLRHTVMTYVNRREVVG